MGLGPDRQEGRRDAAQQEEGQGLRKRQVPKQQAPNHRQQLGHLPQRKDGEGERHQPDPNHQVLVNATLRSGVRGLLAAYLGCAAVSACASDSGRVAREAPMQPPSAVLHDRQLPLFTFDWLAVDGSERRPPSSHVAWPPPDTGNANNGWLTLHTSGRPYLVEVNGYSRVDSSGIPEGDGNVWTCRAGSADPCSIRGGSTGHTSIAMPRSLFQGPRNTYATIQIYWSVPPEERTSSYPEVGEVTAVWLWHGASERNQ